jgi:enterochelin esterase family protein
MKESLFVFLILLIFISFNCTGNGEEYKLTSDSLPQEGVPKGKVTKHVWDTSKIYPETTRDYWVYVPKQYESSKPACVMIFQDGEVFIDEEGPVNIPVVFDNLIHKQEMPVTIAILINSGIKDGKSQRRLEYGTVSDTYARFLLEEIIPEVGKHYNLTNDREGRAISGSSAGGICSYIVGWERNDAFSKVVSFIGGFVGVPGAGEYPSKARITRGDPKPLRVYLQTGENDLNFILGDVKLGNMDMANALEFAGYDYRFEMGTGGHDLKHGGANLPNTLRWLWRDYPGVKGYEEAIEEKAKSQALALPGKSISVSIEDTKYIFEFGKGGSVTISGGNAKDGLMAQYKIDGQTIYIWTNDMLLTCIYENGELEIKDGNILDTKPDAEIPSVAGQALTTKDGDEIYTWKFEEGGKLTLLGEGLGDGMELKYKQNGQNISIWGDDWQLQATYDGKDFDIGKGDQKEEVEYELSGDSLPQEGVPKGKIRKYSWDNSNIYPGSTRNYWIYVPSQYEPAKPACLMVFFDGEWFKNRVSTVFDNLIHKKAMPVTIGLFINPGEITQPKFKVDKSAGSVPPISGKTFTTKDGDYESTWIFAENAKVQVKDRGGKGYTGTYEQKGQWVHIKAGDEFWAKYDGEKFEIFGTKDNRGIEYDTVDDRNARFIVEEILPEVVKEYNITKDPAGRAISGFSSGGSGAFNVAWQMPDQFSKVLSFCASYTNCRGGNAYPTMVRKTRGNPKPLRLFLVGADDDLNIREGNWTIGNLKMQSALKFARYDYKFAMGSGGHEMNFGYSIFPETLRWLWRDYQGVKSEGIVNSSPETITGEWDVETIIWDVELSSVLTLTTSDAKLSATFKDQKNNQFNISNVKFSDDILSFDLIVPDLDEEPLQAWARVEGDQFDGALGGDDDGMAIDFPMKGRKK